MYIVVLPECLVEGALECFGVDLECVCVGGCISACWDMCKVQTYEEIIFRGGGSVCMRITPTIPLLVVRRASNLSPLRKY